MSSPPAAPRVSIVIPAFNKWDYTIRCLVSLLEHTRDVPHEVIVVDNASSDETRQALPLLEGIRLQRNDENLGFARACNQGAALARAPYILFLNNDTEATPGWLAPMVRILDQRPEVGAVGSKLLFPDGTLQHAGVAFAYAAPLPIYPFHLEYRQPADRSTQELELNAVTAACVLVRAEAFRAVGGFDEGFKNGYEDMDLCLSLRAGGHRIVYTPESVLYHHESVSEGRFLSARENEDRLMRRWMGRFEAFDVDRRRTDARRPPRAGRPPVSLVVPVLDALRAIGPCLEDLALGTGPQDELVVADGGCTDCTLQFVERFSAAHPGLVRIVRAEAPGLPAAARAGLAAARHATCVQLPAARTNASFLDDLTALLDGKRAPALAVVRVGQAGFCAAGPRPALQALAGAEPAPLFQADPAAVDRAAQALKLGRVQHV
ncbi:MAG: glycosyltransferase [Anaeromyxobacter sp.]